MLLAAHCLIQSALDFLMVAQCASLLHKVTITGGDLLQLPWVKGWLSSGGEKGVGRHTQYTYHMVSYYADIGGNTSGTDDSARPASMYTTEHISSVASTTSDSTENTSSITSSSHKQSRTEKERRSRIPTHARESGDGMDADQLAQTENEMSFGKLGMRASNLQLNYAGVTESGEDADDEGMGRYHSSHMWSNLHKTKLVSSYILLDLQWSSLHQLSSPPGELLVLEVEQNQEHQRAARVTHVLPRRRMRRV